LNFVTYATYVINVTLHDFKITHSSFLSDRAAPFALTSPIILLRCILQMIFKLSNGVVLALTAFGMSGLFGYSAAAQGVATGQLERSEPNTALISTNQTEQTAPRRPSKRVLKELDKPMKGFSLNGSLDGEPAPPIPYQPNRQAVPNKRLQEIMERRREWIFMRPEDFTSGPTPEEIMNLPEYGSDGQEKKKPSPLERFFQDFGQKPKAIKSGMDNEPFASKTGKSRASGFGSEDDEDTSLPEGIRESAKKLRSLLGTGGTDTDNNTGTSGHSVLSDIFGLGSDTDLTPEQIKEHKDYMKQYQDLLNGPKLPPNSSSLGGMAPAQASPDPAGLLGNAYGPLRPQGYDPTIGGVNPTYVPSAPSDVNSRVLSQWNPMQSYSTPPPQSPAPQPFSPIVQFPRRKFN
jgi:hypothetical protein